MLFNSYLFVLVFLPLVWAVYFALQRRKGHRSAVGWLVTGSLVFYGYWNPAYLILLLGSIIFNYFIGRTLSRDFSHRKFLLIFGISVNLVGLGYFKYTFFFLDNLHWLTNIKIDLGEIVLPLAISFFTFQQITYLVDAYRNEIQESSFLEYCLFVTFFPQLIAGPIVHHKEMMPQFLNPESSRIRSEYLAMGIGIFGMGLFKKVVIADQMALYANPVFDAAHMGVTLTFFDAWLGAFAYTFQLYFDFSGYSDMAIGLALLFGIRLPINFNSPYQSLNIIDFWRRWHMTLARFLRDYIYIPLGGNRRGAPRSYLNIMITMLLGGLWHGASWNFVIWGGLHGFYLFVNHAWERVRESLSEGNVLSRAVSYLAWPLTFISVLLGWVLFRAETLDGALYIYQGMSGANGYVLPTKFKTSMDFLESMGVQFNTTLILGDRHHYFHILALIVMVKYLPNTLFLFKIEDGSSWLGSWWKRARFSFNYPWAIATALLLYISLSLFSRVSEFIYFQF